MSIHGVLRFAGSFAGLWALSGCLSTEPTFTEEPTFAEEVSGFVTEGVALDARYNTTAASMPTTGTATFTGQSGLGLTSAAGDDYLFIGDAAVLADFQNGTMDGTLGSFRGVVEAGGVGPVSEAVDYGGTITLSNGAIGATQANDFDGDFDGTLTGAGNVIFVDGAFYGFFKGNPFQGIVGGSSAGGLVPPVGTINGVAANNIFLDFWAK